MSRSTKHNTHIYVVHPPPPRGYIHQLFFFISVLNHLQHRATKNPSSHRTKDLRSSLDPSSLRYSTKPSITSHSNLHLALQALYSHAQSTYKTLLALSLHHIDAPSFMYLLTLPSLLIYTYKSGPKRG
jgi:hypothetical protein